MKEDRTKERRKEGKKPRLIDGIETIPIASVATKVPKLRCRVALVEGAGGGVHKDEGCN
jgi:hypothetical protein